MVLPVWVQWVGTIGVIATALTALIILLRKLWPALTTFVRTVNALADLPQFIIRTAATLKDQDVTLKAHGESLEGISHEIHENSGKTLKDAIVRIEGKTDKNTRSLATLAAGQRKTREGIEGLYSRVDANEKAATQDRADIAAAQRELEDTRPVAKRIKE